MTHTEGDGDWRMRPSRESNYPVEGGAWIVYRAVWRDAPGCWMLDLSTHEEHASYVAARGALLAKRREEGT